MHDSTGAAVPSSQLCCCWLNVILVGVTGPCRGVQGHRSHGTHLVLVARLHAVQMLCVYCCRLTLSVSVHSARYTSGPHCCHANIMLLLTHQFLCWQWVRWFHFLPRDATHSADYAVARCLSLCPSVTHRYSVETVIHIFRLIFNNRVAPPF